MCELHNNTSVYGLHFLNVHLAGRFGVMTYEEMEMIMVKPNARERGTNMASS